MPTAEVLAHGKWSVTAYRRGTNYIQGYTNVGDFAGTFAVGIGDRAELFTSFLFDTRIDRDVRPIFVPNNTEFGSFVGSLSAGESDLDGRQRRRLVRRREGELPVGVPAAARRRWRCAAC